jgi:hypothetical protein
METTESPESESLFVCHVWPAYVGFGTEHQLFLPLTQRGLIYWSLRANGQFAGACGGPNDALNQQGAWVPKGVYTRLMFFRDPNGPDCGTVAFDQPYTVPFDQYVVVDPIVNNDPVISEMGAITR